MGCYEKEGKQSVQGRNLGSKGVHTPGAASKDCNGNNASLARACHDNLTRRISGAVAGSRHAADTADVFVVHSDALQNTACAAVDDADAACLV